MKKKLFAGVFALVFCLSLSISVFAANESGFSSEYYRVQDNADLLTQEEQDTLLQELDEISQRQKMDIVIATTNSLDGKDVVAYADDLYDECDYGYGEQKDGVLLLISMEDRDWYISTCGYGITAFTDAGIQYIGEQMLSDLSEGDYAAAFDVFAEQCDSFITQARNDEPFDSKNLPREPLGNKWILISIVVGVVLAFLVVGGMKGQLKSVRSKPTARDYLREGSFEVTESRDLFLYSHVDKTARPDDDDDDYSSGSSTHTSSSGQTHGGGGGKF